MPLECAGLHNLRDLRGRIAELVVRVVVVRAEAKAGVGPEVTEDSTLGELGVNGLELRRADGDRPAAPSRVAWAAELEAGLVEELDQQLGLPERVPADPVDADLLDQVVPGGRGEERGHVRRAREEARRAVRVLELRFEAERARVRLPPGEGRLEHVREIWSHVEPAVSGTAAQPLDAAADCEVDVQRRDVKRDDPRGLVRIEDDMRADLVRAVDDRLDVLDLAGLEEDVRDRDEER